MKATAETLTNEEIIEWEADELDRLRSPRTKGLAVDTATTALMTGIEPHVGIRLSPERREARERIAAAINARKASNTMRGYGAKVEYRSGKMTAHGAELRAAQLWSKGEAIGQVRWRRRRSPRFWVGVCFSDGRSPETKGESNVDWESAFAIAAGNLR